MRNSNPTPTPMVPTPYLITFIDYHLPYKARTMFILFSKHPMVFFHAIGERIFGDALKRE